MRKANETGVIRTKKGRKCRFNMWEPKDFGFGVHARKKFENAVAKYGRNNIKRCYTYKALNRLIQGSAADQTKAAVVACKDKLNKLPILQIHDELCFNVYEEKEIEEIKAVMENCMDLNVPSVVDVALGKTFGEAT